MSEDMKESKNNGQEINLKEVELQNNEDKQLEKKSSSKKLKKGDSSVKENRGPSYYRCSFMCIWMWIVVLFGYLVLYGFNFLYMWLLLYACTINTLGSLIAYSVLFIVTITIIVGCVFYGSVSSLQSQTAFAILNMEGSKK